MADGSRHQMSYVPETVYGITPDNPVFKPIRHTGTTLGLSKESLQSEEIRSDRQISDFRHGARQVGGEISAEFSFGSFDDLLEAVLMGTWVSDVLKAGVVRRSFTVERHFADLGPTAKAYHRFTGVEFNTLELGVTANAIVTLGFGVVGQDLVTADAPVAGATYEPAPTGAVLDSFTGNLLEGGQPIAVVTEISLNLENGLDPRFVVGSSKSIRPSVGRSNVSGQVTAYFEDSALMDKFINETETSLEFALPDGRGNSYTFRLPRIKYTGGQPDVSGDGPIMLTMPFQALLDEAEETNLIIERTVA